MNQGGLELTLLGKPGCHLCEAVEAHLRSLGPLMPKLTIVNIETNRELHDRYQLRIPIVTIGGGVVFEANMMDSEGKWKERLIQLLASRTH